MTDCGKTHKNENFPVASRLLRAENRGVILAFYDFARAADEIADDPTLAAEDKLSRLDQMEAALMSDEGDPLHVALRERGLSARHAQDLLVAFRTDVTKASYADWWELMGYCAYSANPVGRFLLDVHGEDARLWPASDAICSSLQIINHLQDCGEDYRKLGRVYLPLQDRVEASALGERRVSPELRSVIVALAERTRALLQEGRGLAGSVVDWRLRLEIGVIYALAHAHLDRLMRMDPLVQRTKLPRWQMGLIAGATVARAFVGGSRG